MNNNLIRIDTWSGAYLVLNVDTFFPCSKSRLTALYRQFLRDSRRDETIPEILSQLRQKKYDMKCYFARFENPNLEMKKSRAFTMLISNINQLKGYIHEK